MHVIHNTCKRITSDKRLKEYTRCSDVVKLESPGDRDISVDIFDGIQIRGPLFTWVKIVTE